MADITRTLTGCYAYFKHDHSSELEQIDRSMRVRLCSIMRKRWGGKGRGKHQSRNRSKPLNGVPDAGDPQVRFGGRSGVNQCPVPVSIRV